MNLDREQSAESPPRVLLFDEHAGSRVVMSYALAALGYECVAVGEVDHALFLAPKFDPHVVIYEWHSRPSRHGLGRAFRDCRPNRSLVVIVLSSIDEPTGFREREAVDCYLMKPFAPRDLRIALASAGRARGGM